MVDVYINANTNINYPGAPSFGCGFGGGAITLFTKPEQLAPVDHGVVR
jgi:hypothetical protein